MKTSQLSPREKKALPMVYLFMVPTVVIFLVFYLSPIITVLITSLTQWDGFNAPVYVGFRNFQRLFARQSFGISLKNLVGWSLISMTVHVMIGTLVAFLMFDKFKGWKFVRAAYMVPNVISIAAWAMIYRFVFNDSYGLLNNLIRLVDPNFHIKWFFQTPAAFWAITFTWVFYAVVVSLIVLGDLMAIPQELHEAARIDGANGWQITWRINLPLIRNALGTSVLISGTARLGMYETIALTTGGGPGQDTMSLSIMLVNSITDMKYGMANAIGVIMFFIGILLLLAIRRIFRMNEQIY